MSDQNVSYSKKFLSLVSSTAFFALGVVYSAVKFSRSFSPQSSANLINVNLTNTTNVSHVFDFQFINKSGTFVHDKMLGGVGLGISWLMRDYSIGPLLVFSVLCFLSSVYRAPAKIVRLCFGHHQEGIQKLEIGSLTKMVSAAITSSIVGLFSKIHNTDIYVFVCASFVSFLCSLMVGFSSENTGLIDSIFGVFFGLSIMFFYEKHFSNSLYSMVVCCFALVAHIMLREVDSGNSNDDGNDDDRKSKNQRKREKKKKKKEEEKKKNIMDEQSQMASLTEEDLEMGPIMTDMVDDPRHQRASTSQVPSSSRGIQSLRRRTQSFTEE